MNNIIIPTSFLRLWWYFQLNFRYTQAGAIRLDDLEVEILLLFYFHLEGHSSVLDLGPWLEFAVWEPAVLTSERHQNHLFVERDFCQQNCSDSLKKTTSLVMYISWSIFLCASYELHPYNYATWYLQLNPIRTKYYNCCNIGCLRTLIHKPKG